MLESEADRLASIQANGGELFDTGRPVRLWGIFERPFEEVLLSEHAFASRRPELLCRTSDVAAHALVKQSRITRVADGSSFSVKELEDDGTGMTVLVLGV